MSTIDVRKGGTTGHPAPARTTRPYVVDKRVKVADLVTAKGSAIADGDIVELFNAPADTMLLGGFIEVETASGTSGATVTIDYGWSGNTDVIIDGWSGYSVGYATTGTNGSLNRTALFEDSTPLFATLHVGSTGTLTTGTYRFGAVMADVGDYILV